ncbi:SMC family ATPase [Dyadobacter luteus]|uniref:SMC family ATPase n=1 Tax=Dyadobacter luteus TaxID=2259619 RepID=A0A3D8YD80_9BACT|nr:SMC family ATPase [Dyadobacter luteus]REA62055.1 SMC family ATPase [Dyadobacter luteus]
MIPKSLKIKGLYSYLTEQEIEFDALTDASLFGIFGSVGSGKSSILEAITFALYGDTERLNKAGDDRTYNMMNLRSDDLLIDFECIAGKNADNYRFTVKGKRNSKNFKEVKTFERKAYIQKEGNWMPLPEHETTESIIGLSYDNFRRTIIIPQGRFQEFIELKDAERTRMMKELFQLEKYDLSRKVGTLSKQNDLELSNLDGQLQAVAEIDQQAIDTREEQKQSVLTTILQASEKLSLLAAELEKMQSLKLAFEKMQLLNEQLVTLESRKSQMEEREESLRLFEICSIHFKTLLDQQKSLTAATARDKNTYELNAGKEKELSETLIKQKETQESLKNAYDKRQELIDLAEELEKVIGIKQLGEKLAQLKNRLVKAEEQLKAKQAAIEILQQEKKTLETDNDLNKTQLIDIHVLSQIKGWFATADEIEQNRKALLKEAEDLKNEQLVFTEKLSGKVKKAIDFFTLELSIQAGSEEIEKAVNKYLTQSEAERERIAQLSVRIQTQIALHQYASGLSDGDPCPLCGSAHHPSILHQDENLTEQLSLEENRRLQLQKMEDSVRRFQADTLKDFSSIENIEKQKNNIRNRYAEIKERIKAHDLIFVWEKFSKENREAFEQELARMEQLQKQIREVEVKIKNKTAELEKSLTEKTEVFEKPLNELRNNILQNESTASTLTSQLVQVKLSDWADVEQDTIVQKAAELKTSYSEIKQLYETTVAQIDINEKEKDIISGSQNTLLKALENHQQELNHVRDALTKQLAQFEFQSEDFVEKILLNPIAIEHERREIDTFKSALRNIKQELDTLKETHQDNHYQAETHQLLITEKAALDASLSDLRKEEGRLEGLLKKLKEDLTRKTNLLKEIAKLKIRKSHLDDLAKLFRSSGFVDYASSIYLQNLIQAANHRFHQMTHQQLHLELGDGNSFWVRDLLNGGHMRLLKTLSGGQKFQAALSLALALADHIHIRNESRHNFFFLDEGFGSLDKNALQTVFETLKSLRKENRIVGIISHVEDLQQEIQTYLKVEQTEEGSKIIPSWK